jgi:hypothetical protein
MMNSFFEESRIKITSNQLLASVLTLTVSALA